MGTTLLICPSIFWSLSVDANELFAQPVTQLLWLIFLNSCGAHVLNIFLDGTLAWHAPLKKVVFLDACGHFMDHKSTPSEARSMVIISFGWMEDAIHQISIVSSVITNTNNGSLHSLKKSSTITCQTSRLRLILNLILAWNAPQSLLLEMSMPMSCLSGNQCLPCKSNNVVRCYNTILVVQCVTYMGTRTSVDFSSLMKW